ncbi:type II toxin-antitoxin system ParD family antitoxin [Sphingomonas sp.]|uniref:ribbon-helix-helix domain-containing protein n=1 Tax=Sphingomonas sp. TaxID=28214 RepID=UPI0035BC2C28
MGEIRRVEAPVDAELGDEIASAIADGTYADVEAIVETAMRRWQEDRMVERIGIDRLRSMWEEGIASGDPVDANDAFFEDVKRRGRARLAALREGR